jgi:hypothetical protein
MPPKETTEFIQNQIDMKQFKKFVAKTTVRDFTFSIEESLPEIGFYLYVFKDGRCIRDDLQDTLQACKEIALEMYGVPMDAWSEETDPPTLDEK